MKSFFIKIWNWLKRHANAILTSAAALVALATIWTGFTLLIPVIVQLPLFFFWMAYIVSFTATALLTYAVITAMFEFIAIPATA